MEKRIELECRGRKAEEVCTTLHVMLSGQEAGSIQCMTCESLIVRCRHVTFFGIAKFFRAQIRLYKPSTRIACNCYLVYVARIMTVSATDKSCESSKQIKHGAQF